MTRYYRYTEEEYFSDGVDLSYVIGYGYKPSNNHRFYCEEIPTREIFLVMRKENPKGACADCLFDWCNNYGIDYGQWLDDNSKKEKE